MTTLSSTSVLRLSTSAFTADFRRNMEALPLTVDGTLLLRLQKQVGMQSNDIHSLRLIHTILGYWYLRFSMADWLPPIKLAKQRMCRQVCIRVTKGC